MCYDHPNQQYYNSSFGQGPDQENLLYVLERVRTVNPECKIVLVGVSYGAATILNFIRQQPLSALANIQAVIVESPFIRIEDVWAYSMARFLGRLSGPLSSWVVRMLKAYNPDAETLITRAQYVPRNLPILVGALTKDHVVRYSDVERIVALLQAANKENVHFYAESASSPHRHSYLAHSEEYARSAQNFLKQYCMPC